MSFECNSLIVSSAGSGGLFHVPIHIYALVCVAVCLFCVFYVLNDIDKIIIIINLSFVISICK